MLAVVALVLAVTLSPVVRPGHVRMELPYPGFKHQQVSLSLWGIQFLMSPTYHGLVLVQGATARPLTPAGNGTAYHHYDLAHINNATLHSSSDGHREVVCNQHPPFKVVGIDSTQFPLIVRRRFSVVITVACELVTKVKLEFKVDDDLQAVELPGSQCQDNHIKYHYNYGMFSEVDYSTLAVVWHKSDGTLQRVRGTPISG